MVLQEESRGGGRGRQRGRDTAVRAGCTGRDPTLASTASLPFSSTTRSFQSPPTCFIIPPGCIQLRMEQLLGSNSCPLLGARTERLPHNESYVGNSHAPHASLILESPTQRCPECSSHPNTSHPECLLKNQRPDSSRESVRASLQQLPSHLSWNQQCLFRPLKLL